MVRVFRTQRRPFILSLACVALVGCGRVESEQGPPPPPEVLVSLPVSRTVTDYEDFTGRTEAVKMIEIRARVTGYLDQVHFEEGSEVAQGAPLFDIDPRPYQAELDRTEANVFQAEAHLTRLNADCARAVMLRPKGAIGQEEYDKIIGDRAEADAGVRAAKAYRNIAKLNLTFTKVTAPIAGRVSKQFIDPGNLVKADETALTTIVSLDPIYAYFDVDERTHLKLRRLVLDGMAKFGRETALPVSMGLADEQGYPHPGKINFEDNRIDSTTGTLRIRAVFPNTQRLLSPGLFARIRLPIGAPYQAILMSEQALGTDQGQKFIYVVGNKNEVAYRAVKVGRLHDGLRVITEGLALGEKVVVSGLQRVQPGHTVDPKVVDLPVRTSKP
jgi:RND family efflux transporter MFP subunit